MSGEIYVTARRTIEDVDPGELVYAKDEQGFIQVGRVVKTARTTTFHYQLTTVAQKVLAVGLQGTTVLVLTKSTAAPGACQREVDA